MQHLQRDITIFNLVTSRPEDSSHQRSACFGANPCYSPHPHQDCRTMSSTSGDRIRHGPETTPDRPNRKCPRTAAAVRDTIHTLSSLALIRQCKPRHKTAMPPIDHNNTVPPSTQKRQVVVRPRFHRSGAVRPDGDQHRTPRPFVVKNSIAYYPRYPPLPGLRRSNPDQGCCHHLVSGSLRRNDLSAALRNQFTDAKSSIVKTCAATRRHPCHAA